jgi:hypothetical protein
MVPVSISKTYLAYAYAARNLLITYCLATGFTILTIIIGAKAIFSNGRSFDWNFSTIMAMTRHPTLTSVLDGESGEIRKSMMPVKLRLRNQARGEYKGAGGFKVVKDIKEDNSTC